MWKGTWGAVKLVLLYLEYWLVGLDEEGFHIAKGNYLSDLGLYAGAAHAYTRALKGTKSPSVHASLGWCYLNMGMPDRAIDSLTTAYAQTARCDYGVTLVHALLEAGKLDESVRLHALLKNGAPEDATALRAELVRLETVLLQAATDRSRVEGHLQNAKADA